MYKLTFYAWKKLLTNGWVKIQTFTQSGQPVKQ